MWVERIGFLLLLAVLGWALYRQIHPSSAWAILVDGRPAAQVSSRRAAKEVFDSILRNQAGEFSSRARFQQAVSIERVSPPVGPFLTQWKAQEEVGRRVNTIIPACWLVIGGKPLFPLLSRTEAEKALRALAQHYLPRGAQLVGEPKFKEGIDFREEAISPARARHILVSQQEAIERLTAPAVAPTEYLIRQGDTGTAIAARYKVGLDDLKRANSEVDLDRLRPGDSIVVAGGRPLLTVVYRIRDITTTEIPYWTEFVPDSSLSPGEREVLQKGEPGKQIIQSLVTYANAKEISRTSRAGKIVKGPVPSRVAVGSTKEQAPEKPRRKSPPQSGKVPH